MFVLAELLVVVYVLGASALPDFAWGTLAMASLFVQWIVLLCAASLCACRRLLVNMSVAFGVAFSFAIIQLVTLLSSVVAMNVFTESTYANLDQWWLLRNQLVAAVIGGIALRYFYMQQQLLAREQAELSARIESLRARIRPHFLFNTMNSIASLIGSRPQQAEAVVEDLSELFRASLVENEANSTVADELQLCSTYLRIEQVRLGDRLKLEWRVSDAAKPAAMPALLLQPLVENAVYHGVAAMPEGGTIQIEVVEREQTICVVISNPVPAKARGGQGGLHMALDNIQQRLLALYGEDDSSFNAVTDGETHRVELKIPRREVGA